MREFEFTVTETSGIHARPAGHIAARMKQFKAEITIEKSGKKANAKKIFEIMGLHIQIGDTVRVTVSGEDEERAFSEAESYLINNF
ncbi:MAG: HPr family phosphocarrier protein [Clostridiales bacterium]|nr:HPr family phosphocarrier protein [Clostridiales bacterium]